MTTARPELVNVEYNICPTLIVTLETQTDSTPKADATSPQIETKPTVLLPVRSIGHEQVSEYGSNELSLTNSQVAIGTADRFQDVIDIYNPPFTIFVIYGATNTELSMYWGGWDLWENASESFIEGQISIKIDEVIGSHPGDYKARGYRVIKCYGQVTNCDTILTFP